MLQLPQTKQDIIVVIAIVTNQPASLLIVRTLVKRYHQTKAMGTQYQLLSPIPKDDAPASEVREFFYQTLIDDFNVPPAEAETIASQWRLGGGRELAFFDREAFRSIFGGEVGTILYEKSRTASSRSTKAENRATFFGMKPIEFLVVMLLGAALLAAICSMVQISAGAKEGAASTWRGAGICFFAAVFVFIMYHIATNL